MDMAEASRGNLSRLPAITGHAQQEEPTRIAQWSDLLCLAVSAAALVADLSTDGILFAEYWRGEERWWAQTTLLLMVAPNAVVQAFSLRWHIADSSATPYHWISHLCLVGLFHRYITLIKSVVTRECHDKQHLQLWRTHLGDLNVLNLFRSFLQSAPQVTLQAYFCIASEQHSNVRAVSLVVSLMCLLWTGLEYGQGCAGRAARLPSMLLRSTWYCGMLAARLAAVVLFAVVFGLWTLVPLGIHWAAMTLWIVSHKTEFCPTKLEELSYNIVMGFIYCFCYFNLRAGRTRYRLMTFYTLMVTQNLASLFLFVLVSDVARQRKAWAVLATVCIVAGTIIGLFSMLLYYRWFHPGGPIKWNNVVDDDIELNNKESMAQAPWRPGKTVASSSHAGRTLKTGACQDHSASGSGSSPQEVTPQPEIGNTDKKFLLDHWIARAGTPTFMSAPIDGTSMDVTGVEFHTVENTPQSNATLSTDSAVSKNKGTSKKKICSPTELNLKLSSIEHIESSIDELTSSNLTLQKRRGICSSDELKEDFEQLDIDDECRKKEKSQKSIDHGSEISQDTDSSNKKTSSDSIDMDLELSFSDINSSDINEFNENIVQKLCLSTLKNIKVGNQDADIQNIQRIALDILKEMYAKKGKHSKVKGRDVLTGSKQDSDTPSEALSVHDYENICAVNIAREAWGLRSWNNYCDMESRQHDGSVGRDPRRDTLTSASSDISSCLSHELLSATAPPAPPGPRRHAPTYCNVFVRQPDAERHQGLSKDETECYTFLAKPCLIEGPTSGPLEPIIEEIDDFGDVEPPCKPRLNSESSLVATIDEIRKGTIANSPRNVYHRRENMWDSPQMNSPAKIETSLKRALWKEPSKFDHSNILESLQEKENNLSEFNQNKFSQCKPPEEILVSSLDISDKRDLRYSGKNTRRNKKVTNLKSEIKNNIAKREEIHDLSNKDVDFLWQLVSDNGIPLQLTSTEDLAAGQMTSSLQSLILKDNVPPVVNYGQKSNVKKTSRNRPRRKFSLLREHFEPKLVKVCDEEANYSHFENKNPDHHGDPMFNVRFQNKLSHVTLEAQTEKCRAEPGEECGRRGEAAEAPAWGRCSPRNIKEKRSLFLKQVLSPPKFNTKTKHKT